VQNQTILRELAADGCYVTQGYDQKFKLRVPYEARSDVQGVDWIGYDKVNLDEGRTQEELIGW